MHVIVGAAHDNLVPQSALHYRTSLSALSTTVGPHAAWKFIGTCRFGIQHCFGQDSLTLHVHIFFRSQIGSRDVLPNDNHRQLVPL